jgi:hypothetical protein
MCELRIYWSVARRKNISVFDERVKRLMDRLTFHIPYDKHMEWFIGVFLTHIHFPLAQQKVTLQPEALYITMKLESSHIGDNDTQITQDQAQLEALTIQL